MNQFIIKHLNHFIKSHPHSTEHYRPTTDISRAGYTSYSLSQQTHVKRRPNGTNEAEMLQYLKEFHGDDITNLLNDSNDSLHVSLSINLSHLQRSRPQLFAEILQDVWSTTPKWDKALLDAQKGLIEGNCFLEDGFQIKENCHVRFVNLPQFDGPLKGSFPGNDNVGQFVQVKGNVVRMTQGKLLEFKREYRCTRCKETYTLEAQYSKMYVFEMPRRCPEPSGLCKGILQPKNPHPKPEYCMDYQEIRIQELFSEKYIPASSLVTLENDLVDYCQPGDCVTICGTIEIRWPQMAKGKHFEVVIVLRAVSVFKDEEKINFGKDLSEQLVWVRAQWQDTIDTMGYLSARDMIVRSICPEIHGMYLVKLAIALALCSGVQCVLTAGANKRGSSHLLLVGDPGLAKSKLLNAASKISVRSVHTTGMGCSAAGLTAAAIKEEGEWQLEAGALVLADGGVCCIDEFNLMSENDKASIHEAMEQQTISMAKAGLVCKLSTRCVVLAATNPKNLYSMSESEGTSFINIGIGSPLLSRFDVVLILRDERDPDWDNRISDHILQNTNQKISSEGIWELERLQSHFLAVQDINPQLTNEANIILGTYYKYCRCDVMRDSSRTTARLLDSLNRLAQAHSRLMFREKVEAVDAIATIRLMESSWGFGRLLNSIDILREDLPLGPNEQQVKELTTLLGLDSLDASVLDNLNALNFSKRQSDKNKCQQQESSPIIGNLQNLFGFNKENIKKLQRDDAMLQQQTNSQPDETGRSTLQTISPKNKRVDSKTTPKSAKGKQSTSLKTNSSTPTQKRQCKGNLLNHFTSTCPNTIVDKSPQCSNDDETSLVELSLKSSIDSNLLDDSSDMDLFRTLESVNPHSQTNEAARTTEKRCDASMRSANKMNNGKNESFLDLPFAKEPIASSSLDKEPIAGSSFVEKSIAGPSFAKEPIASTYFAKEPIASTSFAKQPIASPSFAKNSYQCSSARRFYDSLDMSDDFDDADLDLDSDLSYTPKLIESWSQETHKTPKNNLTTDDRKTISAKRSTSSLSQESKEETSNSPRSESSKKARLSTTTLAKLNAFMNPKSVESVSSPRDESVVIRKAARNDEDDSAYNTMSATSLLSASSSNPFLASLDGDLSCLDFDI